MSITGSPEGEPMKVGVAVADLLTGLYATVAILAALNERHTSGLGQHIDLALFDVQIAALANQGMNFLTSGKTPARNGNAHPNIVPYQAFATSDGHIVVAVGNDVQFARFAAVLGLPELSADPRFATNADRVQNRAALIPVLSQKICSLRKLGLLRDLEENRVPAGPINELHEVFADPQIEARGLVVEQDLTEGRPPLKTLGNPIQLSRTPVRYDKAPPRLGAHTEEILRGHLGMPKSKLDQLIEQGAVAQNREPVRRH
jgi:crotonobetainyl-CoA:carnitine CoA-transferase CaiB-like acyl-CoA transferase